MSKKASKSSKRGLVRLICANPQCKNRFTPTSGRQLYCSPQCRRKYLYRKDAVIKFKEPVDDTRTCAWCGREYHRSTGGAKYCSAECRLAANGRKTYDSPLSMRGRGRSKLSLAEANALARTEGLTYGQYFNRYGYDEWPETKRYVRGW